MSTLLQLKFALRSLGNIHRPGNKPDILLFATPRGGSTWAMEILASQPGMKYYDEPLNPRRDYAAGAGITSWEQLMPETGDPEKIVDFIKALQRGEFGLLNPTPFSRNHRFFTNRIVFKIHEIEHLMGLVAQRCNAQIMYLLRHPIATSISRRVLPRLELFLRSERYANLLADPARVREVRAIDANGDQFRKAIVSWCFENIDALRFRNFDGLIVTYEEFVMNPEKACDVLINHFEFPDRDAMMRAFEQPAENISMSHKQTIDIMQRRETRARRHGLVTKWRSRVTADQQRQAADILRLFEIDAYDAYQPMPKDQYLLFPDTRGLFEEAEHATAEQPAMVSA